MESLQENFYNEVAPYRDELFNINAERKLQEKHEQELSSRREVAQKLYDCVMTSRRATNLSEQDSDNRNNVKAEVKELMERIDKSFAVNTNLQDKREAAVAEYTEAVAEKQSIAMQGSLSDDYADVSTQMPSYMDPED